MSDVHAHAPSSTIQLLSLEFGIYDFAGGQDLNVLKDLWGHHSSHHQEVSSGPLPLEHVCPR